MRAIASDESRARRLTATKLHGTSPRGEQSSTEAVAEVQTDNRKGSRWVRNRNNEGQCDRFVKAEKSEEWMARSPVWPDDVIASETASRHQPMNWRDSIWVQDSVTRRRSQSGKLRSVELPMKENVWKRKTDSQTFVFFCSFIFSSQTFVKITRSGIHNYSSTSKSSVFIFKITACLYSSGPDTSATFVDIFYLSLSLYIYIYI